MRSVCLCVWLWRCLLSRTRMYYVATLRRAKQRSHTRQQVQRMTTRSQQTLLAISRCEYWIGRVHTHSSEHIVACIINAGLVSGCCAPVGARVREG